MGRKSLLALGMGIILALFQDSGKMEVVKIVLKMSVITGSIVGKISLRKRGLISSDPVALELIDIIERYTSH